VSRLDHGQNLVELVNFEIENKDESHWCNICRLDLQWQANLRSCGSRLDHAKNLSSWLILKSRARVSRIGAIFVAAACSAKQQ
jgi:hypothetical protein